MNNFYIGEQEEVYTKVYIDGLDYLQKLPGRCASLAFYLANRVSDAGDTYGMCILITQDTKKAFCKDLGWGSISSFNHALTQCVKYHVLYRIDKCFYRLNPYLFGNGQWEDIVKLREEINDQLFEGMGNE